MVEGLALVIKVKIDNYTATEKLLVREGKMNSKISCFVGVAAADLPAAHLQDPTSRDASRTRLSLTL